HVGPGQAGEAKLDMPGQEPGEVLPAAEAGHGAGVEDGTGGAVANADLFGAPGAVEIQEVEGDEVRLAVGEVDIGGEAAAVPGGSQARGGSRGRLQGARVARGGSPDKASWRAGADLGVTWIRAGVAGELIAVVAEAAVPGALHGRVGGDEGGSPR